MSQQRCVLSSSSQCEMRQGAWLLKGNQQRSWAAPDVWGPIWVPHGTLYAIPGPNKRYPHSPIDVNDLCLWLNRGWLNNTMKVMTPRGHQSMGIAQALAMCRWLCNAPQCSCVSSRYDPNTKTSGMSPFSPFVGTHGHPTPPIPAEKQEYPSSPAPKWCTDTPWACLGLAVVCVFTVSQ